MKKISKIFLLTSCSLLAVGTATVMGITLSETQQTKSETSLLELKPSLNLREEEMQGQNLVKANNPSATETPSLKKIEGTKLLKSDVATLGWDTKTSITLADWQAQAPNVTEISDFAESGAGATAAFTQNTILQSIEIPAKVTAINFASFFETTSLKSITFEEGSQLALIGGAAFRKSAITSIQIPNTVTELGNASFQEAPSLIEVMLQEGSKLTKVGPLTFSSSSNITKIQFPYVEGLFSPSNAYTALYGFSQKQWDSIIWTNIPTKDVKVNAIIARNLLKDKTTVTWEELSPFTGIQTNTFRRTAISAITIQWREGFIIEDNSFVDTPLLKNIKMATEYEAGVLNYGFTDEQLSSIQFVSDFSSQGGTAQTVIIIAGTLLGVAAVVTGILFFFIIKNSKENS